MSVKKTIFALLIMFLLILSVVLTPGISTYASTENNLFQDDFQDGNYDTPSWSIDGGNWTIKSDTDNSSNKVLSQSNTSQESYITSGNPLWTDYTFEMRIRQVDGGAYAGILARFQDSSNYYMFRLNPVSTNTLDLSKKVNGTNTTLATKTDFSMIKSKWYTLKMVLRGSSIRCYVDNALVFDVMDTSLTKGKIGIRSKWGTIDADDASVIAADMGVTATPFLLKGQNSVSNIKVQWSTISAATRYNIYRSVNGEGFISLQSVRGTSFDDYGLTVGNKYKYKVEAYNGSTFLASAVTSDCSPYKLLDNLNTYDNNEVSTIIRSNELKVGNTYYKFTYVKKDTGGFKQLIQQTSTDDINYGNDKEVLNYTDDDDLNDCKFESISVIYNEKTNKFVFWAHYENSKDYTLARVAVASATPGERFIYGKSFRPEGNDSHDLSVFKDDDGSAYLISSAHNNADLILYKLTSDWLDVESQEAVIYKGMNREAPSLIKKDGIYYLFTSQAAGWYPSQSMYSSAPSLKGTWSELRKIGNSSTFSAQSGGVIRMKEDNGSNFVMMANRWMFGWKDATNPISQQRMLPISFSNGFAFFDFYDEVLYNADQDIIIPVQNGKLLSQEKTVTASSNTETAAYVNDGDYQTEWIGTKTWPSTWTVDLNATYNLSNIQISWYMMKGSEAYYKYKLEGSIDGLSYTTLLDKSSAYNDYGFTSDRLSGKARFVRVTLVDAKLQNNTNNWYTPQLYEVKVYGN